MQGVVQSALICIFFIAHFCYFLFRLEVWPGYVTAVNEFEGGLMLCCDVSFRVLRTTTVLDEL